ncbi:hypothetical protein GCM10017691_08880 [Pseudonocardia petroleophila]|uniref:DUF2231 domain-containing protein n=1 Tax=Pseudonocardia petroleophila TaxID=37331 RepID=A0A7G7MJF6_9PSEU|nr:DUF2231 domain-containing protein [Pseudonocardia petroleophila]QNG52917.1 hypothetical protein H6H00_02390 [Pseudonocardia petroleophila]
MYTVAGLPLHPLIVHAVVVLLPLATVGTLAAAALPAWRRALAIPTLLVALAGAVAVPLASSSGWRLRSTMGGGSPLVAEHAARASFLLPAAVLFVALLAAVVFADRRVPVAAGGHAGPAPASASRLAAGLAVAAAVVGVVVTALVVWIGHAGASAVWS